MDAGIQVGILFMSTLLVIAEPSWMRKRSETPSTKLQATEYLEKEIRVISQNKWFQATTKQKQKNKKNMFLSLSLCAQD